MGVHVLHLVSLLVRLQECAEEPSHPAYPRQALEEEEEDHPAAWKTGRFQCDQCEFGCKYESTYINHLRTHTGKKTFACPDCEYRATQKGHLKEHIRRGAHIVPRMKLK